MKREEQVDERGKGVLNVLKIRNSRGKWIGKLTKIELYYRLSEGMIMDR